MKNRDRAVMDMPDNLTAMRDSGRLQGWHDPDGRIKYHVGLTRFQKRNLFLSLHSIHCSLFRFMELKNMQIPIQRLPTIGVLAGWQVYEGYVHGFLDLGRRRRDHSMVGQARLS